MNQPNIEMKQLYSILTILIISASNGVAQSNETINPDYDHQYVNVEGDILALPRCEGYIYIQNHPHFEGLIEMTNEGNDRTNYAMAISVQSYNEALKDNWDVSFDEMFTISMANIFKGYELDLNYLDKVYKMYLSKIDKLQENSKEILEEMKEKWQIEFGQPTLLDTYSATEFDKSFIFVMKKQQMNKEDIFLMTNHISILINKKIYTILFQGVYTDKESFYQLKEKSAQLTKDLIKINN